MSFRHGEATYQTNKKILRNKLKQKPAGDENTALIKENADNLATL